MPQINFNPLGTQGPQGFFEGYTQGQQMQMEQLKLDQLRQDREELMQLRAQLKAAGQNDDPTEFFKTLIKTGNPDYMSKGYEGLQRYNEIQRAEKLLGAEFGTPGPTNALAAGAAPATAGAPTGGLAGMTFGGQVGPAPAGLKVSPEDKAYQQAADQWMMGGMQGPAPTRPGAAPANALAPAPGAEAAPANAMVAAPDRVQELRRKIMQYRSVNDPRLKAMAEVYEAELKELTKPQVVSPGATLFVGGQPKFTAAPSPTELQRNYDFARSQGFKGSLFDYERQLKEAGRAPVQPVAPTITQIVDPTDPNKMITVDARRYQGGGAGSPGVIGVAGKEPSAAVRENKAEAGKSQLQDDLENLRASFNRLNELKALPSTERGALSNIMSAAQGSAVGQMGGRAVGSEAQVERDVINSAKQRLLTSIKNATGMSAQQLNSNMELQSMLRSLSDVNLGYEASMRIIDDIENAYVKGGGLKKKGAGAGAGGGAGAGKGGAPSVSNW